MNILSQISANIIQLTYYHLSFFMFQRLRLGVENCVCICEDKVSQLIIPQFCYSSPLSNCKVKCFLDFSLLYPITCCPLQLPSIYKVGSKTNQTFAITSFFFTVENLKHSLLEIVVFTGNRSTPFLQFLPPFGKLPECKFSNGM